MRTGKAVQAPLVVNPAPAMKRLLIVGLTCFVAAAFAGCGSISQKDRSADTEARTYFDRYRQNTDQTIKNIERRVSSQPDPS